MKLPFSDGETWYICQGYNGQISHPNSYALDLSIDSASPGSTGCNPATANSSTGRLVRAPADGTIVYRDTQGVCINLTGQSKSIYVNHLQNPAPIGTIQQNQVLGTVAPPGSLNGQYAHIHIQIHNNFGCAAQGPTVPFSAEQGNAFEGAPDLPDIGGTNQHSGKALVRGAGVDVYFLVDLSGSFSDDLEAFKNQAPVIISELLASNPNTRFGIGRFEDYPIPPFGSASDGDRAYERLVDLTFDSDMVLATINSLSVRYGDDYHESQLPALYQAATGAGQDLSIFGYPEASIPPGQQANFRQGVHKLFLMWTDAPFHLPGDPGSIPYPGPSFQETIDAVLALDPPKVIGITSGGGGMSDLLELAMGTNAYAPEEGADCDGDGTIDINPGSPLVCTISSNGQGIAAAIIALVQAATQPQSVYIPTVLYSATE